MSGRKREAVRMRERGRDGEREMGRRAKKVAKKKTWVLTFVEGWGD